MCPAERTRAPGSLSASRGAPTSFLRALPLTLPSPGLPPGLTLHAVGVGFDLDTMTVVDVSDVVTVQL